MVHSSANIPLAFSPDCLQNVHISLWSVGESVAYHSALSQVNGVNEIVWAFRALQLMDLTTLNADDTTANVRRLCIRATHPFTDHDLSNLSKDVRNKIHTAAVCVYPSRVRDAYETLKSLEFGGKIRIAAVASGFPTGQYSLSSRLQEIHYAIEQGATEIDIVIDRSLVLRAQWSTLYDEIVEMRKACGNLVHMKTILAIGELGTFENVYKAAMVAMFAGADFIKTSTGKESVNATLAVGLVMIRAIQDFYRQTKRKIGFKPAGGVRTVQEAIAWMTLIKLTLGDEWLQANGDLFRFGASGLLDDIEKKIKISFKQHM